MPCLFRCGLFIFRVPKLLLGNTVLFLRFEALLHVAEGCKVIALEAELRLLAFPRRTLGTRTKITNQETHHEPHAKSSTN